MSSGEIIRRRVKDNTIVACSEDQVDFLRILCNISPERVVRIIDSVSKQEGGTRGENTDGGLFFAASVAVNELVKHEHGQTGPQATAWRKLIEAGVINALVDNIICAESCYYKTQLGLPEDLEQKVMDDTQAPYYPSLEILTNSTRFLRRGSGGLTTQDEIFISSLKDKWSSMMQRIWDEPLNSLGAEESHAYERLTVASILNNVVGADPSLLSIAYNDMTIPVITRHWAYSGSCAVNQLDALITSGTLTNLLEPSGSGFPKLVKYLEEHKELTEDKVISQMHIGVGRTPYASECETGKALAEAFGTRLATLNGRDVTSVLYLLRAVLPQNGPSGDAFRGGSIVNEVYWGGLISLLQRIPSGRDLDSAGKPTSKSVLAMPVMILGIAFKNMPPDIRGDLMDVCLKGGLFDALDEAMEDLLEIENMNICFKLVELFLAMQQGLKYYSSDVKVQLCAQFPRWRTLTALLFNNLRQPSETNMSPRDLKLPQMSWQIFASFQAACKPTSMCGLRGCNKVGTARCGTCKVVMYCGRECQKTDWKAHKVLCTKGWMDSVRQAWQDSREVDKLLSAGGRDLRF